MRSALSFLNLANNISNELLQSNEGGQKEANSAMKKLYKNNVMQLAFISSTGRAKEYETWIKRFHATHAGLDRLIEQNLELTEVEEIVNE
jgi:Pyruvate/2-oxoacid:ferredoxin oxidoreductase gamma subunit